MPNTYKVHLIKGGGLLWELPSDLMSKLNLKQNCLTELKFGSLSARVKVVCSKLPEPAGYRIGFSEGALNALRIPRGLTLGIKPLGTGEYRIGPIIGMLTYSQVIAEQNFKSVNKYSKIIRRYVVYAEKMKNYGLFYLFAPGNIHTQTKTISGYRYDPERKVWAAGEFAYPDAVMDRIYPNNQAAHRKLECVIGPDKIFNKKTMINKFEFVNTLISDPVLKNHLPETKLFNRELQIKQFLIKYHQGVFLKPLGGMKGKGIVYVTAQGSGFLSKYMKGKEIVSEKAAHPGEIMTVLRNAGSRERPYIIQGAVRRMEFGQRPFNFRVMVTKNGSGAWHVRAIFAKVAPPGGFLTNRSLGADYILLNDLFRGIANQLSCTKEEFLNLLNRLALKAASGLDNKFGPLGKIGLDIVMDTSGKPWLIEANGNPGSICPRVLSEFPAWAGQVYDDPIAYSLYLSGFNNV